MLIVMGTTLSIPTLNDYVKMFSKQVRSQGGLVVFINKEGLKSKKWADVFDYVVLGDVDEWALNAARHWQEKRPRDWDDHRKVDCKVQARYKLAKEVQIPVDDEA